MSEIYESLLDIEKISNEQKMAVQEVIRLLEHRTNVPVQMIIPELKIAFNLEEIPEYNITQSKWYALTKDERIGANIQGYKIITDENGNKIKIPHVAFSADLDDLDAMVGRISAKLSGLE
jgi:hypothetical protein